MAKNCEICGTLNASTKDRYCRHHARQTLRRLERVGYLEPLEVRTIDGLTRLSSQQFLTLPDERLDQNQ